MIKGQSSGKRFFLSIVTTILGVGLVTFGSWKIYGEFQLIHSPLDHIPGDGEVLEQRSADRGETLESLEEIDFLQVLSLAHGDPLDTAPDLGESPSTGEDLQLLLMDQSSDREKGDLTEKKVEKPVAEPNRLLIPAIQIDAPVVPVALREVEFLGEMYEQWMAPSTGELGWHDNSAKLGKPGNTVINGHSSGYGETFRDLEKLKNGDVVQVLAGGFRYSYVVANTMILKERWESIETRIENARWIKPSHDERLTLISCWPYPSNTHRIVVVATPVGIEKLPDSRLTTKMELQQKP